MADAAQDLNQVISAAVQARIETEVTAALSNSDVFAQFVSGALHAPITVREDYRDRKTTWLNETLRKTIQAATREAVEKLFEDYRPALEVEGIVNVDGQPLVNLRWEDMGVQIKTGEARDLAFTILRVAEWAETDAIMLKGLIEEFDERTAAGFMVMMREARGGDRDRSWGG